MIVAYRRVSTDSQNMDRQEFPDAEKVFEETESGAKRARPELNRMIDYIREGDTVQVHELSRLARSVRDLEDIVQQITDKGCTVHFLSENLKFGGGEDDIFARFQMQILSAFSEMERKLTLKRQAEGIRKAQEAGRYKGKQPTINADKVVELHKNGNTAIHIAKILGISRSSVYRLLSERTGIDT